MSLLTDIGLTNDGWEVLGTVILGTVFAVIGIFVNKDEDKPKDVMRTEVKDPPQPSLLREGERDEKGEG